MLDRAAHLGRDADMLFAQQQRVEQDRGGGDRIDRRIHAIRGHRARQNHHRIHMSRDRGHRRVGEIVRGHIDRLDRGDRGPARRGDALL